jgi:hypothetical protein
MVDMETLLKELPDILDALPNFYMQEWIGTAKWEAQKTWLNNRVFEHIRKNSLTSS